MLDVFKAPKVHQHPDSVRRCEQIGGTDDKPKYCQRVATVFVMVRSPFSGDDRRAFYCSAEHALSESREQWELGATFPDPEEG